MKVSDIKIGKKVSSHLYQYEGDIEPEDFLKVLRYQASRGKRPGYGSERSSLFYTNSNQITRTEFDYIHRYSEKNYEYLLDRYTKDDLVNTVGSAFRILSTTTKAEIIKTILGNKDLIYRFFKKDFIEHCCTSWKSYRQGRTFLTAVSDPAKQLTFPMGYCSKPLSGKHFLQYWVLGSQYGSPDPGPGFTTKALGDCMAINLRDNDAVILKTLHQFLDGGNCRNTIDLHCVDHTVENRDFNLELIHLFDYPLGIFELTDYFGKRKGSKYCTFSHGLHQRVCHESVRNSLDTRFIIAVDSCLLYSGRAHSRESFEKLAWHLKIEYLKDKKILCRVVEQETPETVAAVWDLLTQGNYPNQLCFIEI